MSRERCSPGLKHLITHPVRPQSSELEVRALSNRVSLARGKGNINGINGKGDGLFLLCCCLFVFFLDHRASLQRDYLCLTKPVSIGPFNGSQRNYEETVYRNV